MPKREQKGNTEHKIEDINHIRELIPDYEKQYKEHLDFLQAHLKITNTLEKSAKKASPETQKTIRAEIDKHIDTVLVGKKIKSFITSDTFINGCVFLDYVLNEGIPLPAKTAVAGMFGAYGTVGLAVLEALNVVKKAIPFEDKVKIYKLGVALVVTPIDVIHAFMLDKNKAKDTLYENFNEVVKAGKELLNNDTFTNIMKLPSVIGSMGELINTGKAFYASAKDSIEKYAPTVVSDFSKKFGPLIMQGLDSLKMFGLFTDAKPKHDLSHKGV